MENNKKKYRRYWPTSFLPIDDWLSPVSLCLESHEATGLLPHASDFLLIKDKQDLLGKIQ